MIDPSRPTQEELDSHRRAAGSFVCPEPASPFVNPHRLAGRVVFVTGASSGIGEAAVRRFAAEGAQVVATARRTSRLEIMSKELAAEKLHVLALPCDVTDESSIANAVAKAVSEFGRIDAAFNNAGQGGVGKPLHQIDSASFDSLVSLNLRGVFLSMKYQVPHMIAAGGGSIVVTSSLVAMIPRPGNCDYGASKWALTGLVKCAALDYFSAGIRVNAIAPGPTWSEIIERRVQTEEGRQAVQALGPIAHPDDIACSASFLLSDESKWTTGHLFACGQT